MLRKCALLGMLAPTLKGNDGTMKKYVLHVFLAIGVALVAPACLPSATTPTVDVIASAAMEEAYVIQTLTAMVASPTPSLTLTPSPAPTETLTPEPTAPIKHPVVTANASCRTGPGPEYKLISNIPARKYVNLIGIGSVPGWYVIVNPYFRNPCWIEAIYLKLDPRVDTSAYPTVMAPKP